MDTVWLSQIKLWLLEHASKYEMNHIVQYILKDKSALGYLSEKCTTDPNFISELPTVYLFVLLLKELRGSLLNFQPSNSTIHSFSWDKDALSLIIDFLEVTYKQSRFMDFESFMRLCKLLKVMEIFRLLYETPDNSSVVQRLNMHFPHCSAKFKEKLKEMYGNEGETHSKLIEETHSGTRIFVLKLMLHGSVKQKYLETNFSKDLKKMVKKSLPALDMAISNLKCLTGPTIFEQQFLNCTDEEISLFNDPATLMVLEYLKPGMTEKDFLDLLKVLEHPEFQDLDLSFTPYGESLSMYTSDDDSNIQDGSEINFNLMSKDAIPPSGGDCLTVNGGSELKKYGPLGLGPPSAKKIDTEEISCTQTVEEQMEVLPESEDEEAQF